MQPNAIKVTAKVICKEYHLTDSQVLNPVFSEVDDELVGGEWTEGAKSCSVCGQSDPFVIAFAFEDAEKFWLI